jgi:hypothetical protein
LPSCVEGLSDVTDGHDVGLEVMESAMRDDIIEYIISRQHQKVDGSS